MDRELFIMRHAKSAWNTGQPDISRPLKNRGINAAKRIGDGLTRLGWVPDKILVSPAVRARQTAEMINLGVPVEEDERIYSASLDDLFTVLGAVPEAMNKVMIIGHNPALDSLLLHLVPIADKTDRQENGKLLTTANVARVAISGKWSGLQSQKGQLLGLLRPKEMDD